MSDLPDFVAIIPNPADMPKRWPGFPHALTLLPAGQTLDTLRASPRAWATFLIEPDSADEVLSGLALPEYIKTKTPVLMHARRARDLRPVMRRQPAFERRGFWLEVLAR